MSEDRYRLPTFHDLVRTEGEQKIATIIGSTPGQVRQYRAGINPLNVDHLYALIQAFGSNWVVGAILKIGEKRAKNRAKTRAKK